MHVRQTPRAIMSQTSSNSDSDVPVEAHYKMANREQFDEDFERLTSLNEMARKKILYEGLLIMTFDQIELTFVFRL